MSHSENSRNGEVEMPEVWREKWDYGHSLMLANLTRENILFPSLKHIF